MPINDKSREETLEAGTGICQYCGDEGFDFVGLKSHYAKGHCIPFNETDGPGPGTVRAQQHQEPRCLCEHGARHCPVHQEPRVVEDARDDYAGAMADLDAIVAAYRKRMPNDEWLNLNYPVGCPQCGGFRVGYAPCNNPMHEVVGQEVPLPPIPVEAALQPKPSTEGAGDVVERVARAIYEVEPALTAKGNKIVPWERVGFWFRARAVSRAEAAIAALSRSEVKQENEVVPDDEHMEYCDCCQAFIRIEAEYDELQKAMKKIAYLRPAGDCKNKIIIAMEAIAMQALAALPTPPVQSEGEK